MLETKPHVLVVDVPKGMPADEAAKILSEHVERGYYVRGVTESEPMRVVFARYADADKDKCGEELRAMDLVLANRRKTSTQIVQILCTNGVYRSTQWVNKTLDEL